eukprot:5624587-Pleurochrysis_carterae.AAC.13
MRPSAYCIPSTASHGGHPGKVRWVKTVDTRTAVERVRRINKFIYLIALFNLRVQLVVVQAQVAAVPEHQVPPPIGSLSQRRHCPQSSPGRRKARELAGAVDDETTVHTHAIAGRTQLNRTFITHISMCKIRNRIGQIRSRRFLIRKSCTRSDDRVFRIFRRLQGCICLFLCGGVACIKVLTEPADK